jgi:alpha/beta superfamily hydrolase
VSVAGGSRTIGHPPRALEARLDLPAGLVRAGAVVCHPHPLYGGDMNSSVVVAVGKALVEDGLAVLRFHFGGVGRSQGSWGEGVEETRDVEVALGALAAALPTATDLALVGYSFGAVMALRAANDAAVRRVVAIAPALDLVEPGVLARLGVPLAVVVGERDPFCDLARLRTALAARVAPTSIDAIGGADHFLVGCEDTVAAWVCERLTDLGR